MAVRLRLGMLVALVVLSGGDLSADQTTPRPTTRSPHGALNISCTDCHTFTAWKPLRNLMEFDHGKTRYPLRGLHQGVSCTQCHVSLVFTNVGTRCSDCHADIHRRQFGSQCESCHSVQGWQVSLTSIRNHQNRFPLIGAHATVPCDACHKGAATSQFAGLSTECIACHVQNFAQTTLPNHQVAQFPTTCEQCHTMDSWLGAAFDHAKFTGFALTGMHARLECTACHIGGKFQGTSANCMSCHLKDYTGTTNPNHVQAGLPQDCALCHTTASWAGAKFDHNTFTKFPLTGGHVNVPCAQCHVNGRFAGTPTDCASCHLADFRKTTNPNHVAGGFPTDCAMCHTTSSWAGAAFDHSKTAFPLTGAHLQVSCVNCHVGGKYAGLSTACASCHLADFQKTSNPNHVALGFPTDCSTCHGTASWAGASFDHNTFTKFPLTGAHVTVPCLQCHVNGRFAGTPTDCASCHLADFQKTTNPNHVAAGFPTDCSICHSTASWAGAVFDHSKTQFPLTGAHLQVSNCATCHVGGVYVGLSTACVSCHLSNFNSTTNPNHVAAGFPQQCEVCHTTTAWTPASFDHSKTGFPLTGAHATTPCASCHIGGKYAGTPTDCYSCHKSAYTSVTNPNHVAAGFPTDCSQCHNTTTWAGAVFNHTWFPIYSGAHVPGVWNTCNDCHVNPSNFAVFSCITCHAHEKTTMDSRHQDVRNYVYNSANCYSCHPTGRSD